MGKTGVAVAGAVLAAIAGVPAAGAAQPPARDVALCHWDESAGCSTGQALTTVGDEHVVTAVVTDAAGAPVSGVDVEIREEGPATFPGGSDWTTVTTGPDGGAGATLTATEGGGSSVWAELRSADCGRVEGCVAGPLTIHWEEEPPPWPACGDGQDNDADGFTDFPDDPGCTSPEGESEGHGDPVYYWGRDVRVRFSHWGREKLVVFGRILVAGASAPECVAGMRVRIRRRANGGWIDVARTTTSEDGWFVVVTRDRVARYRAIAPRQHAAEAVCRRATVSKRHRHAAASNDRR